jgi:hypothetical protein
LGPLIDVDLKAGGMHDNECAEEPEILILVLGEEKPRLRELNNPQEVSITKLNREFQVLYDEKVSVQNDAWDYREV